MIPMKIEEKRFQEIKTEYLKHVKKLFLNSKLKKKDKVEADKKKRDSLFATINEELKKLNIEESIEDIFIADFEVLKNIKRKFDDNDIVFDKYKNDKDVQQEGNYVKNSIYDKIYKKFDSLDKAWLIEQLGITVCPYCNRNFINNRNNSTTAQLDHFYPRSKYPIFALSICNLIPSCYACNHIKSATNIGASPYDKNIDFQNNIKFSYIPLKADYLENPNEIEIIIKSEDTNISQNIDTMKIESAYKLNKDYVFEIIKKAKIYNKEFKDELLQNYGDLISSEEELDRLIYGNYVNIEDANKRPLAKLTHDILEELNII